MADEKDCPCSWVDRAKAIAILIAAIGAVIPSTVAATMSILNHSQSVDNGAKIDEARTAADGAEKAAKKVDASVESIFGK